MAMKVISFKVEGNEVQLPSNASLVDGIDNAIDTHIAAYDNATVDAKIAGLSNVYLGKSAKAVDSAKADYATSAGKATNDGSGNQITTTYYKKTDTVDRAAADDQGNNFREKYAMKTGSVANASYATTAGASNSATLDSAGNNINTTYIKEITASGQTVTYKRGNNTTGTFTTKDTTYNAASTTTAGLMSAADKKKLDALSTDTGSFIVSNAATADRLTTARNISIGGGASGTASFDGSADAKISLGSINAASITSGTLAVARGGTGQTALSNVTVGKASKLETARTVALKGAVTGSTTFDGSANVTIATSALDVSTATAGTLAVARGGTGQTSLANVTVGKANQLTNGRNIVLKGAVAGSAIFSGAGDVTINNTIQTTVSLANATFTNVALTGDVSGTGSISNNTLSINTSWHTAHKYTPINQTDNYDLNEIKAPGLYGSNDYMSQYNHRPSVDGLAASFMLLVEITNTQHNIWQTAYTMFSGGFWRRASHDSGATWSPWRRFRGEEVGTYEAEES